MGLHNSRPSSVIETFDPEQYQGKWYRVAGNFDNINSDQIKYSENIEFKNNKIKIELENCGQERCQHTHGQLFRHQNCDILPGSLILQTEDGESNYLILWTDYKNFAVVKTPQECSVRILGRKNELNSHNARVLGRILQDHGYDLDDFFVYV